jgi:branched-chain amino acid transport system ATP-binding protein
MELDRNHSESVLEVKDLFKSFGSLWAINNLSISVEQGSITGLIGPNGAGKTTLFNVIVGEMKPDKGQIFYRDKQITSLKPFQIARLGLGRTYQLIRIFSQMTVLENLLAAANTNKKAGIDKAIELLAKFDLIRYAHDYASQLSLGQQKVLSILRILMLDADLLLLDELAAGVNEEEQKKLLDFIRQLCEHEAKTAFIIEHDMDVISGYCSKVICLNFGEKIAEGSFKEIKGNKNVVDAYFGT